MIRSPRSASATMIRNRVSKMCNGRNTFGKRTAFGNGKIGIDGGSIGAFVVHQSRGATQWIVLVLLFM